MKIWEIYPKLTRAVRFTHESENMEEGHNFDHALSVGQMAFMISEDPYFGKLAGAAGLCHNADRILEKRYVNLKRKEIPTAEIASLVRTWLMKEKLGNECNLIVHAVLRHDEPNNADDDLITVALKDADRIVCLGLDVIIRAAQFYHDIPILDAYYLLGEAIDLPKEKCRGTYTKPLSIIENVRNCLQWVSDDPRFAIRLPKAKKIAERRAEKIRSYFRDIMEQRNETGLIPYPF